MIYVVHGALFGLGFASVVGGVFIISQVVMNKLLADLFID